MARKPAPKPKRAKTPKVSKAAIKAKADAAEITSGMEPDKVTGLKHGRPTKYTPELGKRICEELASGRTLRSVCRDDETMPDERTVRSWAIDAVAANGLIRSYIESAGQGQGEEAARIHGQAIADVFARLKAAGLNGANHGT